ncbi:MAG TPA: 3-oxoacyl-[acyl-carrier-protein] synthase III C-terminal domain-containing protein, partial [Muribaculaceae bacterium]|nr:3-oxoacyl-[acyl-carrier-protein] synthase III C-terminal domain-containing protein [Muribaculaceae bacterium]
EHLVMLGGGSAHPTTQETLDKKWHFLLQDGRHVYKNAVTDMLTSTQDIMKRNKLGVNDIDYIVPHQANLRIIEAVAQRAGIPMDKVLVNIQYRGNTSAASIPICLDEYKHTLKKGDKIILTAFGAGFTWGAMYIVWDM